MNETKILPEGFYSLDTKMSLEKIKRAKETEDFLIANVLYYDYSNRCLRVTLGNGFVGIVPLEESTIYPYSHEYCTNKILPNVYTLIDKNICVCVKEVDSNGEVILSRKQCMVKAFNHISKFNDQILKCKIISIVSYGIFVDAGHGIMGLIHKINLSQTRIMNPKNLGFKVEQTISAKILLVDKENFRLNLTYKVLFEDLSLVLNEGDIVTAMLFDPIDNGFFAFLNPATAAIVDVPVGIDVPYGSKVYAVVKPYRELYPDKIRLKFISFVQ